jgi:hypothetical protein
MFSITTGMTQQVSIVSLTNTYPLTFSYCLFGVQLNEMGAGRREAGVQIKRRLHGQLNAALPRSTACSSCGEACPIIHPPEVVPPGHGRRPRNPLVWVARRQTLPCQPHHGKAGLQPWPVAHGDGCPMQGQVTIELERGPEWRGKNIIMSVLKRVVCDSGGGVLGWVCFRPRQ